ncbi:MAG: threonyl-tRNA synthetase [Parcubacteria group bacterium Gr01-1014_33]|nr:MAG: threonyl-tRNA synthetase [Parcubacteria group bacterium Gr01-1014_33]
MENQGLRIDRIRHSLAHLLAMAVLKKFPDAKLGIGPIIENGFYYDFVITEERGTNADSRGRTLSETDVPQIEETMREFISQNLEFTGEKVTPKEAKKIFKDQPFKLELIEDFVKEEKELTIYRTCPSTTYNLQPTTCFFDLCRGGHVENTSEINPDAFKLTKIAGAYWKGNEKNPQLLRIYGVAFETKKELDAHLAFLEEARRRDHKRLGIELDLFTFSDLVGSGLPLWTPKGTILRNILDDLVWKLRKERGYQQVDIPHIAKKELYERSGHWQKFGDELFKITTREGREFALKPMNCPHHIQIYRRKQFSYRELPQRYASTTKVYRDEQTGELSGLSRVRAITQDDAHVFCRNAQVKEEILKIWEIVTEFYALAGFNLTVRLSLHDPNRPEEYLGSPEIWQDAEEKLREIIQEKGADASEGIGEAAFYGPKIDFMARDSLGREWQVATIQLDMNLPERFDLTCVNEKGEHERIVMLHAAIMGSIERYLSILIEHFAGAFPFWLAPVQVTILPVSEKFQEYAKDILTQLREADIRAELDDSNETLGKRIRESELRKIPYLLVVGEREVASDTIAVRERGKGDTGTMDIDVFLERISH